jgi:hypothetical protein
MAGLREFDTFNIYNDTKIHNVSWVYFQNRGDVKRPIPKSNYYFRAELTPKEGIKIDFENVPRPIVDQFMNSLNITGWGQSPTEESWDDYVARVRIPTQGQLGITTIEFIDEVYNNGARYDPKTGELFGPTDAYPQFGPMPKKEIERLAIGSNYYGPIPLPKNVSISTPNGTDQISLPKVELPNQPINNAPNNEALNRERLNGTTLDPLKNPTAWMDSLLNNSSNHATKPG